MSAADPTETEDTDDHAEEGAASAHVRAQEDDLASRLDQRTKARILIGVLGGLFLAALDQTIVATALPRIVAELHGIDLLAWTATSYLLASTAMVPIYGKLSDLYGRRIILLVGIAVFLFGSALCGIAGSMLTLIVYRGVQGIGAAALTSTAFAIPADLFPPAERPKYQGLFGAVFGLASVIGPFLGGLLTDTIGWRWVFYVNLPLGGLAAAFILSSMPPLRRGLGGRVDYAGALLLVATVVPLLLALSLDKAHHGWSSPLVLSLFAGSAVSLSLFLLVERSATAPILPLSLFKSGTFTWLVLLSALFGAAFFASVLFLSIFMVNVLGVSATRAGTAMIPLTAGLVVGNIVSSIIVQRTGRYKVIVLVGMAIAALGFFWLSRMDAQTTAGGVRLRMVLLGLGMGPALPQLNLAIQLGVPVNMVGTATASRQFFQQIGGTIGAAVFGVVLSTTLTAAIETNLRPVVQAIPAAQRARFDLSTMRNGRGGDDGGRRVSVEETIVQSIHRGFVQQRALVARAFEHGDPVATEALLANPNTPPGVRELLRSGARPPPVVVVRVLGGLDIAETGAVARGRATGRAIDRGLREAFASSVTRIYRMAVPLMALAFLLMLLVKELPLRGRVVGGEGAGPGH